MYYYLYYIISQFTKRHNNRNDDYAFMSILYLILLMGFNVMSIILIFKDKIYFRSHTSLIVIISVIIPTIINYLALIKGKKYLEIIKRYDDKHIETSLNIFAIRLVILYVLITFTLVIYLALIVRAQSDNSA